MNYFVQFLIVFDLICFGVYFGGDIVCTALAKVRKKPGQKDPYESMMTRRPEGGKAASRPPSLSPGHPCYGCGTYRPGQPCVGFCHKELTAWLRERRKQK